MKERKRNDVKAFRGQNGFLAVFSGEGVYKGKEEFTDCGGVRKGVGWG